MSIVAQNLMAHCQWHRWKQWHDPKHFSQFGSEMTKNDYNFRSLSIKLICSVAAKIPFFKHMEHFPTNFDVFTKSIANATTYLLALALPQKTRGSAGVSWMKFDFEKKRFGWAPVLTSKPIFSGLFFNRNVIISHTHVTNGSPVIWLYLEQRCFIYLATTIRHRVRKEDPLDDLRISSLWYLRAADHWWLPRLSADFYTRLGPRRLIL